MSEEKPTRNQIIKKLSEYKGKRNDPVISEQIDFIIYLIDNISDDDLNKSESLELFITDFDNPSRLSNLDGCLAQALNELQKIAEKNAEDIRKVYEELNQTKLKNEAIGNEISRYTKNKKKRKVVSCLLFVGLAIGIVITAVFAFLDNFKVLDCGGVIAGAIGILDFIIGAVAFLVERYSDSKNIKTMEAAEKVRDDNTYKQYQKIILYKNKFKIIDKREINNNYFKDSEKDENEGKQK